MKTKFFGYWTVKCQGVQYTRFWMRDPSDVRIQIPLSQFRLPDEIRDQLVDHLNWMIEVLGCKRQEIDGILDFVHKKYKQRIVAPKPFVSKLPDAKSYNQMAQNYLMVLETELQVDSEIKLDEEVKWFNWFSDSFRCNIE